MKERYDSYKDSGVAWIGQVPKGWEVRRIAYAYAENTKQNTTLEKTEAYQFNYGTLIKKSRKYDESVDSEVYSRYTIFSPDDIVINGLNLNYDFVSQRVAIAQTEGIITSAYVCITPRTNIHSPYFCYLFKAMDAMKLFHGMGTGIRLTLSYDELKKQPIPLPPLPEQRAIAGYLDARCAAIEAYVASLEREAALARELKQAVIARAVTRGLDPNTPMRDSGIPWIGQVPQRWEVDELGRHFRERRTKVSDKEYEPLSVSKHGITPQLDTACKTDNGDNRKLVCKGDFVVNSRSDRKGSCGLSDYDGSVSLINTVLEPIDMDGKYCHYLFRSNDYVEEFYRLGRGIVADLWTTRYDDMKVLKIPLPPLPEQRAIAGYLDARCAAIDAYVASLEREAALARELKAREIADAVTGKVKITA